MQDEAVVRQLLLVLDFQFLVAVCQLLAETLCSRAEVRQQSRHHLDQLCLLLAQAVELFPGLGLAVCELDLDILLPAMFLVAFDESLLGRLEQHPAHAAAHGQLPEPELRVPGLPVLQEVGLVEQLLVVRVMVGVLGVHGRQELVRQKSSHLLVHLELLHLGVRVQL